MDVFINDLAAFMPNGPVANDNIENVLGTINNISLKIKRIVLKNNGILTRYYALDPETGLPTHDNTGLTAEAIRKLKPYEGFQISDIECLACGTSTPDLLFPGHALMVCGELGTNPCEAVTTAGICIAGMTALKYAFMNVATGISRNGVATGSELASSFTRSKFMTPFIKKAESEKIEGEPIRAFDADFLRWMLSDGAGAAFLSDRKNDKGISLRIDWIENITFSGQLDTCMYGGGVKKEDGSVVGWRETERIDPTETPYLFSIRQDIKYLDKHIVETMGDALARTVQRHGLAPGNYDWFLPHYSSHYFRPKFREEMQRRNFEIPEEKWFTNLPQKGNTGSAAIYIILEELFHSDRLKAGERILCFIPESGRFSHCFMQLTVV